MIAAASLAAPASASAAMAPGFVTHPFSSSPTLGIVDVFSPSVGVALPDGSVVLAGIDLGKGALLMKLRRDGSLDPRFGSGGISRVVVPFDQ